jgi:hypothetical protein
MLACHLLNDEEESMRYEVYVPIFGPYGDALVLANLAYEAEEAGWDGFFLWDLVSRTTLAPTIDPMVDRLRTRFGVSAC